MNNLKKLEDLPLEVWVYDVEVFKHYWVITFLNLKTKEKVVVEQNYLGLKNFVNKRLKNAFVGGFNNVRYDDWILKELLLGFNPFKLSNLIVNDNVKVWEIERLKKVKLPFFSFDIMDLLGPSRMSLKKYEAFLGLEIKESDVPFDYDNELNEEQKQEVKKYNYYDVVCSSLLFIKFIDQFIIKLKLITDYKLKSFNLAKTGSQLTAIIFNAKRELLPFYNSYKYECPENVKKFYKEYAPDYFWLINELENKTFYTEFSSEYEKEQVNLSFKFSGLMIDFKSGGLHGAKNIIINNKSNLINKDIVSNYPHLIKHYNFGSRRAPRMSEQIGELLEQRKEAKKLNDVVKSNYLKELVVRPFGAMEYKYNDLWDAKMRMSICLTGELIIFLLAYIISPFCEILQINTDGILFKVESEEQENKIEELSKMWEQKTLMNLETEKYTRIFQKDVNNYVVINDNNKKIKAKGAMVKYWNQQFHNKNFNTVRGVANNNLTAIDEAVVKYLLFDTPLIETLKSIKELIRFQFIFELKGKYTDAFYGDKKLPKRKVWRLFYTKTGSPVFKAYKGEDNEWRLEKVANSSERNKIINIDIRNKTSDFIDLDFDYYEMLAQARVDHYLERKEKSKTNFTITYPGESFECFLCNESLLNELTVRYVLNNEVCKKCYFKTKE